MKVQTKQPLASRTILFSILCAVVAVLAFNAGYIGGETCMLILTACGGNGFLRFNTSGPISPGPAIAWDLGALSVLQDLEKRQAALAQSLGPDAQLANWLDALSLCGYVQEFDGMWEITSRGRELLALVRPTQPPKPKAGVFRSSFTLPSLLVALSLGCASIAIPPPAPVVPCEDHAGCVRLPDYHSLRAYAVQCGGKVDAGSALGWAGTILKFFQGAGVAR